MDVVTIAVSVLIAAIGATGGVAVQAYNARNKTDAETEEIQAKARKVSVEAAESVVELLRVEVERRVAGYEAQLIAHKKEAATQLADCQQQIEGLRSELFRVRADARRSDARVRQLEAAMRAAGVPIPAWPDGPSLQDVMDRMDLNDEDRASIAKDLADSHARADAQQNGAHGAAADASARSGNIAP